MLRQPCQLLTTFDLPRNERFDLIGAAGDSTGAA
jgi:hypothetical protein